jgi:hypothetical protein
MGEGFSIINLGKLSKPATVLIEKISDAVGGIFKPYQMRRLAHAEAEAAMIKAASKITITDLQRRAASRLLNEEAQKQANMESITIKAVPLISEAARSEQVEPDWITNFFDKCRLISDEDMQKLWAKVLAGEANAPGHYSKRTVNLLASLDMEEADRFAKLCAYSWNLGQVDGPLIYDLNDSVYSEGGVSFSALKHLDDIGLISFEPLAGYQKVRLPQTTFALYHGQVVTIEFQNAENNHLNIGHVMLSKAGLELATVCGSKPVPGFVDYIVKKWTELGCKVGVIPAAEIA